MTGLAVSEPGAASRGAGKPVAPYEGTRCELGNWRGYDPEYFVALAQLAARGIQ